MSQKKISQFQSFFANYIPDEPLFPMKICSNGEYMMWGVKNDFPPYLLDLVQNVGELNAIILQMHNYICSATPYNKNKDVVDRLVMDYLIFGGCVCKVVKSKDGSEDYLYYVDIANFRTDETCTKTFLRTDNDSRTFKEVKHKDGVRYYYYKGSNYRTVYPFPIWYSGLKSAEILNQIRIFNLSNIKQNFSGNGILSIKGSTLSSQQMKELKMRIENSFCGAHNAGRVLVVNDNATDCKIEFTRIQPDNLADLYSVLQESAQKDLYIAFRINKMLLGENIMSGFSNQEFRDAFTLFNYSVIIPIQRRIEEFLLKCGIQYKFETTQIQFPNHE